jgi:hypothetical protein
MKKVLSVLILSLFYSFVFSQDLIYTVSGELNKQKTALDSILVENLSNNSWIIFSGLPHEKYYQINLTKKEYWGTTKSNYLADPSGFIESQNIPGSLILTYLDNTPAYTRFSIFNINGQKIFDGIKTVIPGNSVHFQLGGEGVYIIKAESSGLTNTFKAIGAPKQEKFDVEIVNGNFYNTKAKSAHINFDNSFFYSSGDSLRISVYKDEYFAESKLLKIDESKFLNFLFEVNEDSDQVNTSGKIKIEGLSNFDFSKINTLSMKGLSPVKINGMFQVKNARFGVTKQLPLYFTKDENLMFGFQPEKVSNNIVTIDNILLFFFNFFPDIKLKEIEPPALMLLIQNDTYYGSLKNLILLSLQKNNSPVSDSVFVSTLKKSALAVAQRISLKTKNAGMESDDTFRFNFNRNGEMSWAENVPLYAAVGFEIKKEGGNSVVFGPEIIEPEKVIMSPGSIIEFGFDKIFDLKANQPAPFSFKEEGKYTISLTNGNDEGNNPSTLQEVVSTYNKNHLIAGALGIVFPFIEEKLIGKCNSAILNYCSSTIYDVLINKILKEDVTPLFVANELYGILPGAMSVLEECAKAEVNAGKYLRLFAKTFKSLDVLGKAESVVNFVTMAHDFGLSEISGKENRSFYDKFSFGRLIYSRISPNEFKGKPGSAHTFEAGVYEESVTYNFDFQPEKTYFTQKDDFENSKGIPFNVICENNGASSNKTKVESADGKIEVVLTMGKTDSQVKIEPAFKNSGIVPETIAMKVSDICSTYWYTAVMDKVNAMNNAGLAYALSQTRESCIAYKKATQAVLDFLLLYKDCDGWTEDDKKNYETTVTLTNSQLNSLNCE